MKFYYLKSEFIPVNIVEIQYLKKITTVETQIENLILMKNQLKILLNVEFDIRSDLKILKKLD